MEKYELTFPQKNIWLVENFYNDSRINIISGSLVIQKEFDINLAEKTVNKFVELNAAMRLRLCIENGKPMQYLADFSVFEADKIDASDKTELEIEEIKRKYIATPIDIIDRPLFSYLLIDEGSGKGEIFLKAHHLICDGWSGSKMVMGLADIYDKILAGDNDFKEQPSYISFLQKESEYSNSQKFDEDKAYWLDYLKGFEEVVQLKKTTSLSTTGVRYKTKLDKLQNDLILNFCKENRLSPYSLYMAALAIYMSRVTEKRDIVIGTPVLNRSNFAEKQMQGMFVSTMPVRFRLEDENTFKELCILNSKEAMSSFRHQKFPFAITNAEIKKANENIEELFTVMLSYQNARAKFDKPDMYRMTWNFSGYIQNELEIHIVDLNDDGILEVDFDYNTELFNSTEIKYIADRINKIITDGILNDKKLADIEIMDREEKDLILNGFNNKISSSISTKTVIELFEENVKLNPEKLAIVFKDKKVTYNKLDKRASQIANMLANKGLKPMDCIGIMQSKSIDIVATILGVLKLGAIYVPLDANATLTSKRHVIKTANIKVIVIDKDRAKIDNVDYININNITGTDSYISYKSKPDDTINIMFTSGTTGEPKGVCITNENVINLVTNTNYLHLEKQDKMLQTGSFTFDASTLEVWNALLNDVTIYMVSDELFSPNEFKEYIKTNNITVIFLTAALFNQMVASDASMFNDVKVVMTGGEAMSKEHAFKFKKLNPNTVLKNLYGPTENTVVSTYYDVTGNERIIPIGKPITNTTCYILDSKLRLLPIGVIGTLYVGGKGVAKGYINNEKLTNDRFITHSNFGKLYNTGDLCYYNEEGKLIFVGRKDREIKIKGIRVDLEEIKEKVNKFGKIQASELVYIENQNTKYLGLVFVSEIREEIESIKKYLKRYLPIQILPRKIVQLAQIPLTANGKTDVKEIKKIIQNTDTEISNSETEFKGIYKEIYDIFKDTLDMKGIGMDDDFFDIGGDSLLGVSLVTRAMEKGIQISYNDLYKYRTIRGLGDMYNANNNVSSYFGNLADYDYSDIDRLLKSGIEHNCECKDIILSGATGFLGSHILAELLDSRQGKIYCVVRRSTTRTAIERLKQRLNYYFGNKYDKAFENRIVVLQYETELSSSFMETLPKQNVTHFINSLALVKHYGDIDEFYTVNVESAKLMAEYCVKNNVELIHISTLSVSGDIVETAQKLDGKVTEKKIYTEQDLYLGQELENVYAYTKFLAERNILEMAVNSGLKCKIFRMGNLVDRYLDGKFQINDKENAFSNRLASLIKMGVLPEEIKHQSLDFTQVDIAAKAINNLINVNNKNIVYHLFNTNKVEINRIVEILKRLNIHLVYENSSNTSKMIKDAIENNETEKYNGIITDITKDSTLRYVTDINVIGNKTSEILESLNFNWPQVDDDYIIKMLNRIINKEG